MNSYKPGMANFIIRDIRSTIFLKKRVTIYLLKSWHLTHSNMCLYVLVVGDKRGGRIKPTWYFINNTIDQTSLCDRPIDRGRLVGHSCYKLLDSIWISWIPMDSHRAFAYIYVIAFQILGFWKRTRMGYIYSRTPANILLNILRYKTYTSMLRTK